MTRSNVKWVLKKLVIFVKNKEKSAEMQFNISCLIFISIYNVEKKMVEECEQEWSFIENGNYEYIYI